MGVALLACSRDPLGSSDTRSGAITGPITISGTITDAGGLPLPGVRVNLDGTSQAVRTTTASGTYSFPGLRAGSYSVRPTLNNCSFVPDVVNLNNLSASRVQNFSGSGSGCGGTPSVGGGAMSGPFTISGRVRDTNNRPVVGARINMNGTAQALRFTDVTGGYTFRVDRGSYSLSISGACSFNPTNANINNVTGNRVQNFTATSIGCVTSTMSNATGSGAVFTVNQGTTVLGVTFADLEPRSSNASSMARLQEILTEVTPTMTRSLTIAGLPAVERQSLLEKESERPPRQSPRLLLTTAIATGTTVVRFESQVPANANVATINTFFTTARNFTTDAIPALHGPPRAPIPAAPRVPPATPPPRPNPLFATSVTSNVGEISVAASDSSNAVVYARNPGFGGSRVTSSQDAGATIQNSTVTLNAASSTFVVAGDPVLTIGAPNAMGAQSFYYLEIAQSSVSMMLGSLFALVVYQSADNGVTFNQTNGFPIDCTATGNCTLPDQPMFVADKLTRSTQGDRLYAVWRHFGTTSFATGLSCSSDGGNTWSTADLGTMPSGSDFSRIAVGPDGALYVSYATGTGASSYQFWVNKYSSCDNGFAKQPNFPRRVASSAGSISEMPGLDRIINGGSYMVAADDSDPTGQRVFAIYVEQLSLDMTRAVGTSNVRIAESTDGGLNWTVMGFPLNSNSNGHRFMPWLCSTNGIVYATWYDRRNSSATNADPTAYFRVSFGDPTNSGVPMLGAEVNVSGGAAFDDPQCTSGFYPNIAGGMGAARNPLQETLCTNLPALPTQVLAGACTSCPGQAGTQVCGTGTPCDFRVTTNACATMGETCLPQSGLPKYGDYNGAGCANGQLYMAWASAVTPQGINCAVPGAACTVAANCCGGSTCVGGLCSPGGACTGNGNACANSNVCCSRNCFGGTCQAGVSIFASSTGVTTTATCTTAVPDATFNAPFQIDTGLPPSMVGAGYGTPACPSQFLVDVDLTQAGFMGQDLFVSGRWSLSQPAMPCDEAATMTVFASTDGTNWQTYDIVQYAAVLDGTICHAEAQSHTDPGSVNLGGTNVPASGNFQRVRVAISATQTGTLLPVLVIGEAL